MKTKHKDSDRALNGKIGAIQFLYKQTIEMREECISEGQLWPFNSRIVANLIKSMAETWVVKRWDLRGYADRWRWRRRSSNLKHRRIDSRSVVHFN